MPLALAGDKRKMRRGFGEFEFGGTAGGLLAETANAVRAFRRCLRGRPERARLLEFVGIEE